MSKLLNTELFCLLGKNSQEATNYEMHIAYEKFVNQVQHQNQPDNDYSVVYRMLNSTRIEFMALQALFQCEQGKKCAEKSVSM